MKTIGALKAQTSAPVWQPTEKTESILKQVRKLTGELQTLQNELYRELSEEDGTRREDSLLRQSPACDQLKILQTAADQLRRVLWFYLDLESQHHAADTAHSEFGNAEEWLRQESRHEAGLSEQRPMEAGSFFQRLNLAIDGYMRDRGLSGKREVNKP
jgi:hypothetical protein